MGNKRIYKLFMLFVFLIFFGCKKNYYSYGDDYINLSGKYTEDNKYYDSQAGEYNAYFRMSKSGDINSGNDVYDTIAICPIKFGNHADRYVYCKLPVSAFASMLPHSEDRNAIAFCTDSIEIVLPYYVRIWSLNSHKEKFDYEFGWCIKSYVKTIIGKQYVITLSMRPRYIYYKSKNSKLRFTDQIYIGMGFDDLELRRDGRRLSFADGYDVNKYDIVGSEWMDGKSPVLFDK